jgi:hypothetical protein
MRAVGDRRVVELRREGDQAWRLVHPHVVFLTAAGDVALSAYQVGGWSGSGELPGWRTFELARIAEVRLLVARFALAPGYDPLSPRYRHGRLAAA